MKESYSSGGLVPAQAARAPVPLILLHGFTGTGAAWDTVRARLPATVVATAPDLPGHGSAPAPTRSGEAGYADLLADLDARLAAAAADRPAYLWGYSQGARLALALAVRHPERVAGLVLESGSPGLHDPGEQAARRASDEALAARIERDGVDAFLDAWEALPLFGGLRRLPPSERQALRARRGANTAAGLAAALRAYGTGVQPSYWDRLAGLDLPVLLVTGEADPKFTELARHMAERLPRAEHRVLARVGHAPHLEAPDEMAGLVLGWIDRTERDRAGG